MSKKIRTKKVPATTNNITAGIIAFLNNRGHYAVRINTQGQFVEKSPASGMLKSAAAQLRAFGYTVGRRQKTASTIGVADIIVCMRPHGYMVAIEIKNLETKDKARPEQEHYSRQLTAAGGRYLIVTIYEQFINWYNTATDCTDQFQ